MTEFQISGVQDTQNKAKAKQKTQVKSGSAKDIQVFSDKKQNQGPLRPDDYKIPSIFDNTPKFELDKNMPWKKAQPKVPFMTKEMRQEYDRDTIVGIYKALDNPKVSKDNTQKLYQTIHHLDYQNYKMAFRSFEQIGVNLVDVINRTKHLSNDQKKECLDYMVDLGKKTADYGNQRSDDVVPSMKKLVAQYDSQHGLDEVSKKRLVADFKKIINRSDTLKTAVPERPNGKIDRSYKQGQTGDCWLLAGIQSLAMTPQGKKLLDNAVKVDKNGNATVTLKGVGKKYTVTARDLKCSNELSTGDTDVRALEIAMDRYFRESVTAEEGSQADIDGNSVGKGLALLGDPSKTKEYAGQREVAQGIVALANSGMKGKAAVTGMSGNIDPRDIKAYDENGKRVQVYNAHAYSVQEIALDGITLVNPHDTSHTLKMSLEDYIKHFNLLGVTDTSGLK